MTEMIVVKNLTKAFGENVAVDRLSFSIPKGKVFGLLGPNGAGKTTTLRMLTALISPSSGEASVAGYKIGVDDYNVRKNVGILTESPGMYDRLSAERNLSFFAALYEVENPEVQIKKYLQMLGLWHRRKEEVGTFSKGMKQKLAIARALVHEPRVLLLDEPTSGLDPEAAKMVREFILELKNEGRTIMICTHNLDEADRLCDRVAVFKSQMLALDTPANLRSQLFGRSVVFHLTEVKDSYAESIQSLDFVQSCQKLENKLVVTLPDPESYNPQIVNLLVKDGAEIRFIGEIRRSLEDVYLHLINKSNVEDNNE
jgi:ABC-2 type transport system ATP-binding protein